MYKIESGIQLLARLTKRPCVKEFYPSLFESGPVSDDFIEIFSAINPSHLLIDIISEALIQTYLKNTPAGILIFDTDGNLKYDELINVIRKKIWSSINKKYNVGFEDVCVNQKLEEVLTNLHILNIYDATELYTTIYNLENILVEHPNISIIIFNTLTAFYWSEQGFKITKMEFYTKSLINMIQKVTKEFKTICMYTRPEYFCTSKHNEKISGELTYQIQVLDNGKGNFLVDIKTTSVRQTKFFRIINSDLIWI